MAYSTNILPKDEAYYTLSNANIVGSSIELSSNGFVEIQVSKQMLPKLTSKMLLVVHPSVFSDSYTNEGVQVTLSIITSSGKYIEYLVPVSYDASGVFNTEINFIENATSATDEDYVMFTYRLSSKVPVSIYNWELCAEEASDVTAVIDGVEQEMPKLLYDYNTYAYAVAQKELTVGLISCYLLSSTSLQGHFTLSFFATERCNVHVRIKDNGVTELFSPQVYTVEKGYASISIPHAYLNKLATDHAFSVTLQCTNGQLSIPVRGLLYTIDGGYLATRLMDAGIDIEDISIRQLPTDAEPSEIWAVGFEGIRLVLKKRVYSNALRENWQAVKDFGEALRAGVEFRGHWMGRGREEKYTIETETTPYVFVVDTAHNLIVYSGTSFDKQTVLDTDVYECVSACQGFNSMKYEEQDQGLVVAYIKNGNVYYRQLTYYFATWLPVLPIYEGGDATFVSIHRLPDYRLGICVEHSNGTAWYITDRTYVNQAVKPELIDTYTDNVPIATVYDVSMATDNVEVQATLNTFGNEVYHNGFTMTFDYPLKLLSGKTVDDLKDAMKATVGGTVVEIDEVSIQGNTLSVRLKEAARGGRAAVISYSFFYLAAVIYNGCYAAVRQTHTWQLPLPTYTLDATEEASIDVKSSLAVNIKSLETAYKASSETIEANLNASLNASVITLTMLQANAPKETIDVPLTPSADIVVSLVGTTPI